MTEVIGVRFNKVSKKYYFDPNGLAVEAGQFVIVETSQGTEYAQCLAGNHEVADDAVVAPLRPVVRIATENDWLDKIGFLSYDEPASSAHFSTSKPSTRQARPFSGSFAPSFIPGRSSFTNALVRRMKSVAQSRYSH